MQTPGILLLLYGVNSLKQTLTGSHDPLVHTNGQDQTSSAQKRGDPKAAPICLASTGLSHADYLTTRFPPFR
jgi:hypothetical protein